ncbi:hypothetical protein BDK51DRAFT_45284 [Blyttiomyces helicus]|uniref:Uncharacterized protein n=1 Tax=Blyttiomyces helicus TaxID=388810 RepID=A0A4P9WHG4_9FUNG|nr:hypothetical protein BDK51DRAFT_45284 [Blyttiomyces helicus]|eukprot:RKO91822.1 hypothetical protein BDK51DRAFT_45284 [Blyttiomyces helicus]
MFPQRPVRSLLLLVLMSTHPCSTRSSNPSNVDTAIVETYKLDPASLMSAHPARYARARIEQSGPPKRRGPIRHQASSSGITVTLTCGSPSTQAQPPPAGAVHAGSNRAFARRAATVRGGGSRGASDGERERVLVLRGGGGDRRVDAGERG